MATVSDSSRPIRVFMIDDTAIVTEILSQEIARNRDIQLVGIARCASRAIEKIAQLKPDVITLDIEMPGLDVPNIVGKLIAHPLVVLTSSTDEGAALAMEALSAGAVDVVYKPV